MKQTKSEADRILEIWKSTQVKPVRERIKIYRTLAFQAEKFITAHSDKMSPSQRDEFLKMAYDLRAHEHGFPGSGHRLVPKMSLLICKATYGREPTILEEKKLKPTIEDLGDIIVSGSKEFDPSHFSDFLEHNWEKELYSPLKAQGKLFHVRCEVDDSPKYKIIKVDLPEPILPMKKMKAYETNHGFFHLNCPQGKLYLFYLGVSDKQNFLEIDVPVGQVKACVFENPGREVAVVVVTGSG